MTTILLAFDKGLVLDEECKHYYKTFSFLRYTQLFVNETSKDSLNISI